MDKLTTVLADFVQQQVEGGAQVIQVFDSWAGALGIEDYRQYCLPATTELVQRIRSLGVPVIYFGVNTTSLLPSMIETTADIIGLDWRVPLNQGWKAVGESRAIQGNLDPIALLGPNKVLRSKVEDILTSANGRPGHIFNVGHGIVPETRVEKVIDVVKWVKRFHSNKEKVIR
jgi:uroporphyrinogen decarboxylase